MNISPRARSAVLVLIDLARRRDAAPVALSELSRRYGMSVSYLEQVFARLRRNRLVRSVRGPGGGYLLARPAAALRVADIVVAVDGAGAFSAGKDCSDGWLAGDPTRCLNHELWEQAGAEVHRYLASVSLADICARRMLAPAPPVEAAAAE